MWAVDKDGATEHLVSVTRITDCVQPLGMFEIASAAVHMTRRWGNG